MNDKYQKLYQYLSSNGMTDLDMNSFYNEYSSNPNKVKKLYSYLSQNGLTDLDEVSFSNEYFAVKKKKVSQSTQKNGAISSAISKTAQKKPSVSSGESYNWNGQNYIYRNNRWEETALFEGDKSIPQSQKSAFKKVTDRNKIKKLNYQFKKDVSLDPIDQVYSNYDEEKKDNEYRVKNGTWQRKVPGATSWTTITNEGSVNALNRRYNQNVKYTPQVQVKKSEPKLKFADVNTSLVAKTEEDAVGTLSKKYGKYGFTFEQSGFGTDYVTVYNKDKSKEITIGFDEKNPEEALKLKNFLEQNASQETSSAYNKIKEKKNVTRDYENISAYDSEKMKKSKEKREKELSSYLDSEEYNNDFKSLSYDEMKEEVKDRISNLMRWRQTDPSMQKDLDKFYNSEAYKIYKRKKKEEFGARDERIDLLYTELQTAKASGNKAAIKDINSKITAYLTDDVIQDQVKNYNIQLNDLDNAAKKLVADQKKYLQSVNDFNKRSQSGKMTQEEFDQNKKILDEQAESLETRADFLISSGKSIQNNQKKLNVVAGKYVTEKSKAGGFFGGVVNSFLTGISKSLVEVPLTLVASSESSKKYDYNMLSPEEKQYYKDKGYSEEETKNILSNERIRDLKDQSRKALTDIIGSDLTSKEYMKSKDRGFFEKAIYGVAESVPAMLMGGGGYAASFTGLAAQSYSSIEDEMLDDPDFKTLSVKERAVVAVPYAIAMGVLENYGLKNVIKGQSFTGGIVKKILTSSISKMPKGASREVLQSIMDKEVKNLIAKGSLRIINGAIAEFETGATQSLLLDIGLKSLYNKLAQSGMTEEEVKKLSGGEMFATPDSVGEIASTVLEDGLAEAVGGATIGTFTNVASGLMNGNISLYNEEDLEYLKEISQDSNFKKIIVANLKTEMLKGNLTKSEAQERLSAMNELASVVESIPDGLTKEDQIDAVNMLSEKNRLTREIQGKDPALVTAQTERINEINEELKTISKNAIQVETTGEVSVQPEAIVSREVEEGKPKTESQDFTEKSQAIQEVIDRARSRLLSTENKSEFDKNPIENAKKDIEERINYIESLEEIDSVDERILKELKDDYNTLTTEEVVETEEDIKAKEILPQLANAERTMIQLGRTTNPNNTNEVTYTDLSDVSVKDDFTPFYKSIIDYLKKNNEVTIYDKANNKTYKFNLDGNILVSTLVPNGRIQKATSQVQKETTAQINIAPLFDTKVKTIEEAEAIRQSDMYQTYKKDMSDTAKRFGVQVDAIDDTIGGYEGVSEVSTVVNVTGDWNNIVEFAAVYGAIAPEVQDSTIAGRTVEPQTTEHNADRFDIGIDNQEAALKAAEDAGFSQDGFTMSGNKIMFFNIFDYPVVGFDEKYANFVDKYLEYGGNITSESKSAVQSEFIDSDRRAEIIEKIEGNAVQQGRWESIRDVIQKAKERNKGYRERKAGVTTIQQIYPQENLVTEENVEELRAQQTTPRAQKIFTAAKLAMKALPGVRIYIHKNKAEYEAGINEVADNNEYGSYLNGEIHINLEGANVVTVLHEAMHHALVIKGIKSGAMLDLARGLKSVVTDKQLKQRLEEFTSRYKEEDDRSEEYAAELGAIMAEAKQELTTTKFQQFKNLINKIAKKLGLPVVFSEAANAKNAVDFMNSLTKAIRTGENIEPYTSGESATVIKDAPLKVRKKRISDYTADFVAKLPTKTLKEIINKYEGRVFFIQSDATGIGYDSKGDPIYGGLGYITIKENVDGSIGFASVDDGTAKTTISKMINRYGEGKKVGVFVMIQNPSSTVGNYYGAKYFGRALIQLQKKSKTNYKDIANSFIDYIRSNKKIVDELNKNKTQQKLIDLIKNPEIYNEKTFAEEFIKDTTFEARRTILESLIPITSDVKTNKSTPYIKQSLKDIGFNRLDFLKEYGDNTLFTEDMYLGNEGGFLAAGFEIELPKKEQLDEFISKYKNNGVKHPQFNGKLPSTGESFLLDGLYPVNENFVEYAKDETLIDRDVLSDEELKNIVQESFPNDSFYEDKFTSINSDKYIPRENRTYAHLKTPNKIIFKSNLEKTNPKALKSKPADIATNVARGMGFSPEVGEKQLKLTQKTEFTKREAQAKRKKQLSDSKDIAIQKAKEKYTLSVEQRGNPHQQGVDASLNDLRKSDWYKSADDTQRENAERELKEFFGERLKKAPSVAKVLGKPKAKKVAIKDEYKAMITQIKMEAKAAREAKADLNAKRKMLAAAISGMVKTGKMKASQAAVLVKRVSNLNLDNPVMVDRFTNYAQRVFERADYQQRLDDAFSIRKSIRKLLKTDNQAEVSGMAKAFTKIDPSLVEDIDAYIEMADKVKNAVKPSRVKGLDVVMKESANIAEISEYTSQEIERQEEIKKQELLATYDFLEGDMSLKEMQDIINALKDPTSKMDTAEKEKYVKDYLNGRFGIMSSILDTMFNTGIDPMTGEEITFDEKQKELIKRALNINLNEMSVRDAIKIVESLENFITNQITSGLEAAVSSYEGAMNVKSLVNRGKKAKSLRLFFSKYVGKIYSEQLFSLPALMEKMFGGVTNSLDVMNKMGLTKLINGVNKANRQHNDIIDQYAKQEFYKSKDFMDAENVYERGMLAFLKRNLVGNPTEMKEEFERRVRMIQESINKLIEDGDSKEQKMGELYQKIYDKLGVSEMDMDIINANASKNNLDAVNWWVNQWSQHYSDLSDISLSVYNTQLGSDLNYTPDKYKKLSSENQSLDEGVVERNGAFAISIDYTDKNKTGVLMETTRPNVMPDGRYISLDFDTNNSKALKSALVDINTASAIRQVDGFINSKSFKKLIPESEDRTIMTKRINTYIRRAKGKSIVSSDTIQYLNKLTNYITSLGVGKALGGINQAVMQTTPVMVNTIVNAGRFDIADANFNAWLNKSGLPISNRGLESQSTVESIDRKIDMKGTGTQEALKAIANLNQWYLKQFLVKPDVFVARSSFKSYYLQNLKRRGISTDINWTTHEMDMEAAEYAQAMIDRQQNISDPMLAGEFLASDDPIKQIARKVILPFASFILNQKARMYNDMMTIASKTSSTQDKAIARRSLAGLAAELATYQLIGFGIRRLYDIIAASLLGDEDDEETKKKKMINATKYPIKSIVNDIVSPLPMTDGITTWGFNQALAQYPWMSDKEIKDAVESRNKVLELKGEPNMTEAEEKEFIDNIKEEATYQVFDDEFNRSYGMIGIVGSTYKELGEMSKLATTGEFTDEYQGRETTKKLLESDREKVKYAVPFMIAYSTGLLPKDVGAISRNYVNRIKKKAITEKQYERYDAVQKDLGRNLKSWETELVKEKKESETAISEIEFIERNGGLTERQGREYLKLMKAIGEPSVSDIVKIKEGQTADQILK